jgi:superfamily II DNA or RNA helicase
MEIVDNKAVLVRTRHPEKFEVIPKSKVIERYEGGGALVAVHWGLDEMRVLRNIGIRKAPSPIVAKYDWPGRYQPMKHQVETASFLTLYRRAFCFNEPGTGKTLSALWAADYLMTRGEVRRVLILCPMSIMHSAWLGDISNSIIHRSAIVAHHSKASRRIEMVQGDYEFVITNYEGLNLIAHEVRSNGKFDLIIVDEANAYKNPMTQRWKSLASVVRPDTMVWMMTGTPAAQSPVDAYGLAKIVAPSNVPKFFTAWRDQVMLKVTNFKWVPKPTARDTVFDVLQPAIRFAKKDCLDLPPVVVETRDVEMTPQQAKYYNMLKTQLTVQTAGETISAVNAGVAVNKLLQISCIAYNTPVLTDSGWVPIQSVRDTDLVWDGEEFVVHRGLLPRGRKNVLDCFGVYMTPDHRVLTEGGWRTAWSCLYGCGEGFDRASVRLPDGLVSSRHERWESEEGAVALPVCLRKQSGSREPVSARSEPSGAEALRLSAWQQDACDVAHAPLQNLDKHAQALPRPERQRLAQLRGAGYQGEPPVGGEFRSVLEGHGADLRSRDDLGAQEQQWPVLESELPVGNTTGAGEQHSQNGMAENAEGAADTGASRSRVRAALRDAGGTSEALRVAAAESLGDAREAEVFDIAHCGPRNRFVVLGEDGEPLIVHNCGAAYTDANEVVEFDARPRLRVVEEVIEETARKVIIFAMFRSSMDALAEHLTKKGYKVAQINGDVSASKRGQIIHTFQETDELDVLILQAQATAHGITLTAADTAIFYGPLMSVELYIQCVARVDRKGQTSESVRAVHIQSSPIERKLFAAMANRVSDHSLLVDLFGSEIKK